MTTPSFRSAALTAALTIFAACGESAETDSGTAARPDAGGMDAAQPDAEPARDAGTNTVCASDGTAAAFDMTGLWATRTINAQKFDGTLGPGDVTITTIFRVDITQVGTTITNQSQACTVEVSPYNNNTTRYPQSALMAIVAQSNVITLAAPMIGAGYTQQRVQLVGWMTAADPRVDPLPQMDTDPRVVDADSDGHPGVTLEVDGNLDGVIYIVNRSIVDLTGTVKNNRCVSGSSRTMQEQKVLGADPAILGFSNVMATPDPDASKSTFATVRMPAGVSTCAEILAARATLFP